MKCVIFEKKEILITIYFYCAVAFKVQMVSVSIFLLKFLQAARGFHAKIIITHI